MGKDEKFNLQESDDTNMNRSPIDGIMPYGGFLKDIIYPEFYGVSTYIMGMPQITNTNDSILKKQANSDFNNLKK